MAWGPDSGRTAPLPDNWSELREDQLKRDGYRCVWKLPSGKRCPRKATDVDHKGDANDHSRLRSLCSHHHGKRTAMQGFAARKPPKSKRVRFEETPGLLG